MAARQTEKARRRSGGIRQPMTQRMSCSWFESETCLSAPCTIRSKTLSQLTKLDDPTSF